MQNSWDHKREHFKTPENRQPDPEKTEVSKRLKKRTEISNKLMDETSIDRDVY